MMMEKVKVLSLALGAVVAAAAGDDDSFDGRLADETGLGLAAVHPVLELEESFFAIGVHIVRDGRASEGNCFSQNLFQRQEEFAHLVAGDGGSTAAGSKA